MKNLFSAIVFFCAISFSFSSCQNDDLGNFSESVLVEDNCTTCNTEEAFSNSVRTSVNVSGMTMTAVEGHLVFEGDIVLSDEQIDLLDQPETRGTAYMDLAKRWPGNVVYYTFAAGFPNAARVKSAIAHWESKTNIRFVESKTAKNYIEFIAGSGCWSYMGMIGGKQQLSVDKNCSLGNAIHEIGHAIGLFHEHTRMDRDKYITINWSNITAGSEGNFYIYTQKGYRGADFGEFDFGSIMLYSSTSFRKAGCGATMVKKNGTTFVGQRTGLSSGDIAAINYMYPAK